MSWLHRVLAVRFRDGRGRSRLIVMKNATVTEWTQLIDHATDEERGGRSMRIGFSVGAVGLAAVLVVACSGGAGSQQGGGASGQDTMREKDVCVLTYFDDCEHTLDDCWNQCSLETSCSYCLEIDCSTSSIDCEEYGPSFELPKQANTKNQAACEKAVARDQSCNEKTVVPDCAHYAHVERDEVGANYDCVSALPCGADATQCEPPPGTLGDQICAGNSCGICTPELQSWLNDETGWLRDDVQSALMACVGKSTCDYASQCLKAWLDTVYPDIVHPE